eukprot:TRINITY_DN27323_c0_g1_i1.p2 TRINITY_DN27323_c0_g1~~TRINITY_DN27323_c0_g1_i1.p2  ORF type:complete len:114 (-),score=6.53 TRINITY_DN27323_c0_g1_i1:318-659(-)
MYDKSAHVNKTHITSIAQSPNARLAASSALALSTASAPASLADWSVTHHNSSARQHALLLPSNGMVVCICCLHSSLGYCWVISRIRIGYGLNCNWNLCCENDFGDGTGLGGRK